jgi:hypothetical protein
VRVLVPFSSLASFRLLHSVAGSCAGRGWTVEMLFCGEDEALHATARAECTGIALSRLRDDCDDTLPAAAPHRRRMPHPLRSRLLARAARYRRCRDLSIFCDLHARDLATAEACLERNRPDVVVVAEDGISAPLALMAAIRHRGIPLVDVPYGFGLAIDFDVDLQHKQEAGVLVRPDGWAAAGMRLVAPQWVKRGAFKGALMYRPAYILGAEAMGLTVRDAWTVHGGFADRLCAESEVNRRHYLAEGIPAAKIALTGSPYCDMVVRAVAQDPAALAAFRQPRRIGDGALRLLVSWPPSYHATRASHCDFASYDEMTRTVLGHLHELPDLDLTVSLHPAVDAATRTVVTGLGIRVSDGYIIDLIPRHDAFLTYYSSTIRWAIAAGKPVVNYDLYRLGMDIYDAAPGVVRVETFDAMRTIILALAGKPGTFEQLAAAQAEVADDWGPMDGRCTERILAEIERLAA